MIYNTLFAAVEVMQPDAPKTGLETGDWAVIFIYFLGMAGIVWWSSKSQNSAEDYFLGGRNIGWFAIGASLFASNIGSEHIVGLAGSGVSTGLGMAHWELHAWIMIMLAYLFVPFYYRSGVMTMPEFLERRFDGKTRGVLSVVSLVAYVFTKVSVTVYAGAKVFELLLPDTFGSPENAFWIGAISTVILTGVYTVFGGFRAVVYTDTVQAFILLIGSAAITYYGLTLLAGEGGSLGQGWATLTDTFRSFATENTGTDLEHKFKLWKPNSDPGFPMWGIIIASPIVGIWYWCTDQYIVQRTLAAKDLKTARRGAIFGGFLKIWPVFIFLVPGLIGYALHQKGLVALPIKGDGGIDGDAVFPTMVATLLPTGLRGLVVGGLLAALMSSLSSLFNSCASLFTVDIYEKFKPLKAEADDEEKASYEKTLVNVGRMATCVVVVLGLVWIPIMKAISSGGLYVYLQSVQGYLAPCITAVFLLGLFWKRVNHQAAFIGLVSGFTLGMIKLTLQAFTDKFEVGGFLHGIASLNFLFASGYLFAIAIFTVVAVTLATPPPAKEKIEGLTFGSLTDKDRAELEEAKDPVATIGAVIVLALVFGVYYYFSIWF